MEREGLSQVELAKGAGVSQSSVSRALRGVPIRHGAARTRLFTYAGLIGRRGGRSQTKSSKIIVAAYEQVVARSDTLAKAVVTVVRALANSRQ
jgi:hypothetical protein